MHRRLITWQDWQDEEKKEKREEKNTTRTKKEACKNDDITTIISLTVLM